MLQEFSEDACVLRIDSVVRVAGCQQLIYGLQATCSVQQAAVWLAERNTICRLLCQAGLEQHM